MGSVLSCQRKSAKDQVVLITGCTTGGIGHALAIEYAKRGATVYATSRRKETMQGFEAYSNIVLVELDVTKEDTIKAAVDVIISRSRRIDILINNAGIGCMGPVAEAPVSAFRRVWDTNVGGVIAMSQAVFPHMADRGAGTIVNISSLSGRIALPLWGTYTTSKNALDALTQCMRMEMRPFGVAVMLVPLGFVATPMSSKVPGDSTDCFVPGGRYAPWFDTGLGDLSQMLSREAISPQKMAAQLVTATLSKWVPWEFFINFPLYARIMTAIVPRYVQDMLLMFSYWGVIRKQKQERRDQLLDKKLS